MKTRPMKEMMLVQNWKVGDAVVSIVSDFNLTEGKEYTILGRDAFPDCFFIINDLGEKEAYSEDYFKLVVNE